MSVVLGIDIGTSSIKSMLLDTEKGVIAVKSKEYHVDIPQKNYAEQSPKMWWSSLLETLGWLKENYGTAYRKIAAVGYSGQMHGLVLIGKHEEPVRPAIIWLDQRAGKQLEEIDALISKEEMGRILCNRVSIGFAFPSLLWVKEMEPKIFSEVKSILCPKDYVRLKMTGKIGTEVVDASSTGIFSTAKRDWAWEWIDQFEFPREIFPPVSESGDIAGTITKSCAEETGLPEGIPVIFGTGDQPAQSIGNGVIREGKLICNIGTGGQISAFAKAPVYDQQLRTNTFCHAIRDSYTIFGAALCSGMSLNWVKNKVMHIDNYATVNTMAASVKPGSDGLLYLPYLSGERTPHMNPNAKGVFFGMTLEHEQGHFLRSVMEGVTYSLKDSLEIIHELGVDDSSIVASGGGALSEQWLQIQADIFEKPVCANRVKEQACLGSCILAAAGTGILPSIEAGCEKFVAMDDRIFYPDKRKVEIYREGYEKYKVLYQRLWDLM